MPVVGDLQGIARKYEHLLEDVEKYWAPEMGRSIQSYALGRLEVVWLLDYTLTLKQWF